MRFSDPEAASANPAKADQPFNIEMLSVRSRSRIVREAKVEVNYSGTPCATPSIRVDSHGQLCPVHANTIKFADTSVHPSFGKKYSSYISAQSPQTWSACEKMLLLGIDSKQGLFQFCSPPASWRLNAPRTGAASFNFLMPVMEQLKAEHHDAHTAGEPCILGNRFQVTDIALDAMNDDASRYLLTVKSLADDSQTTIPITSAGLKFTGAVLAQPEIVRAKTLLDEHKESAVKLGGNIEEMPAILSERGMGRNAVLIVYHEISKSIQRGSIRFVATLESRLRELIDQARTARGPGFIDSSDQLRVLQQALEMQMRQRSEALEREERMRR